MDGSVVSARPGKLTPNKEGLPLHFCEIQLQDYCNKHPRSSASLEDLDQSYHVMSDRCLNRFKHSLYWAKVAFKCDIAFF